MTTLNSPVDFQITASENPLAPEGLWPRILSQLEGLFGKAWNYLNEDMGPVDIDDNNQPTGGCCCL
jgi:hypothetical protein